MNRQRPFAARKATHVAFLCIQRKKRPFMRYCPITRNCEFARAYARGKAYVHPYVVLYVNKNRVGHTRVGLTASKKVGNAVMRNRARRVMRAALSEVLRGDVGRYDIVLVARGITPKLKSTKLVPVLKKLLCDAGLAV